MLDWQHVAPGRLVDPTALPQGGTMTAGPLARALNAALRDAPTLKRDGATVALAKRYAALIDESAPASKYREPLTLIKNALPADDQIEAAFRRIVDALSAHSVASDMGPKLLAALTALGMTPAGRGAKDATPPGDGTPKGKADELSERREERERKRRGEGAG